MQPRMSANGDSCESILDEAKSCRCIKDECFESPQERSICNTW